ncbi:TPA: glyoxalase/bleomycin resistance/dioxygenase family protein [Xanthomonas vasicola pv. zeae]|uniref:Glyoxalase n=3 Tax=Xanthomonas vasicola TaxID=56459 RepID=A0A837APG6_XANVA|nr:glyoxalase/bleomycin resistance/dioxygenase family protein [Xanthomonas vasicola pv. vasculorum]AZR30177.1 glyoxalase/bleomycin resistance/dioxygenase family protein [Xanthomonas vasicola pv. musacearum NCPPB 4379]KEZ99278.1 glyoxalase [Xanthomonas vasicola pv. vasculorum NCPPB 895]KFA05739.1 glyoxalase [Xanthomonas vasicola pv. musacearum NCPPB 2005]KFA11085.1 glyoxalase [Xanthomonas vasicola pv. musacearum NCPPB 4380]KFA21714.1 glyoxalase [Xanthomonas vasicola pv. musacearum NCPPB 4392]K
MKIIFVMLLASVAARAQAPTPQAGSSESEAMNNDARIIAVDHTGFAVSSLDEAVRFWTGALGFTLERQSEMGDDFLYQVTGVDDPNVKTAIVRAPDGYVIELLQYSKGRQNGAVPNSAGAIGAAHLALTVNDIHAAIARVEAAGWKAKGSPLPITGGPRKGTLVAYVSGPDHITIELMQPQAH